MNIHIPTPCNEDWNAMTPVGGGRHCAMCQHAVVDFTTMTDEEVLAYLQQQPGRVCGRIQAHRLTQPAQLRPKPIKRALAYFALALALVFGVPVAAQAQLMKEYTLPLQADSTGSVSGRVLEDGEPLGDATIEVKQGESTINGTYTEADGRFIINGLDPGIYDVVVTYLGSEPKIFKGIEVKNRETTLMPPIEIQVGSTQGLIVGLMAAPKYSPARHPTMNQGVKYDNDELMRFP